MKYTQENTRRLAEEYGDEWVKEHVMLAYRGNKDFIKHTGLLDLLHRRGFKGTTQPVVHELPHQGGSFTISVGVITAEGTFWGTGDASPENCKSVAPHFRRMAETRAFNRAARFATNVGMVSTDEVDGDDDSTTTRSKAESRARSEEAPQAEDKPETKPEAKAEEKPLTFDAVAPQQTPKNGEKPASAQQLNAIKMLLVRAGRAGEEPPEGLTVSTAAALIAEVQEAAKAYQATRA